MGFGILAEWSTFEQFHAWPSKLALECPTETSIDSVPLRLQSFTSLDFANFTPFAPNYWTAGVVLSVCRRTSRSSQGILSCTTFRDCGI